MDGQQPTMFNDRLRLRIVAPTGDSRVAIVMQALVEELNTAKDSGSCQQWIIQALIEKKERELYGASGTAVGQDAQSRGANTPVPQLTSQAANSHAPARESNQGATRELAPDKPSLNAMDDGTDSFDHELSAPHPPLGSSLRHDESTFPSVSERRGGRLPAAALDVMG